MNDFLKTRDEIDNVYTKYLVDNNLIQSGISAKNYDIAQVVPYLKGEMDVLDLGSDGSEILSNAVRLEIKGRKVGIDLAYPENAVVGEIELFKGDLMQTPFEDNSFDLISCLSVVEHAVDLDKLAKECARLLRSGGKLFVSFDYWPEKLMTKGVWLYNLEWNILSKEDVEKMVSLFNENGLELSSDIDWTVQDAVINPSYCSPAAGISYSFGMLQFIKQ